ncbi:hypothetical protein [Sinorhizobium meliloti]|uniref:hypothetical protein n=1 Tax=Rhizobium meliloti TaxID=382 RepID=UPI001F302819|nr:hypothetical protein [Sinorhizobium meliloti]
MLNETKAPATGIEAIGPNDAVSENPGARTARIEEVMPTAPIDSDSRRKPDLDLCDTPSLTITKVSSRSEGSAAPSDGAASIAADP